MPKKISSLEWLAGSSAQAIYLRLPYIIISLCSRYLDLPGGYITSTPELPDLLFSGGIS